MTARKFDIQRAYEKLNRAEGTKNIKTIYGARGYQIQQAQPSDDLTYRVAQVAS